MEKLYKLIVFFVGLIAMNLSVQAQLGGYSHVAIIAKTNTSNKLVSSYPYSGYQLSATNDWTNTDYIFIERDATNFTNYPNPAATYTNIAYTLTARANVTLKVIDLTGKQLAVLLKKQEQAAGKQELYWELSKNNITSGMYILVLQVDHKVYSRKMLVQ